MINKKNLKKAISAPFEKEGFSKKGQSWYLEGKDVLIVTNLQISDWDEMCYINVGFWLKGLGDATFPPFNQCHLYYRVENLFPGKRELLIAICSFKDSDLENMNSLSQFIYNDLIPLLKECTDEEELRQLWAQGMLNNGMILKEARQYLLKV